MTFPNASTALATVLVDELVRGGVRSLTLAPGSRSAAVAIAALRDPRLDVAVVVDERSAAFRALGIARASGRPAAVLTTSGSAVAHLFPAVVEASAASVPMIVLSADRPPELHGVGANQTIDQVGIFGSFVTAAFHLGPAEHDADEPARWRETLARAVHAAAGGPVQVNVAFREPVVPETDDGRDRDRPFEFPVDGRADGSPWLDRADSGPEARPVPARYQDTERGVVVAGEAPFASAAEVDRLAATLGWPLIAEPTIGGRPPQTITTAHHVLSAPDLAERLMPEVAVVVGRPTLSRQVASWLDRIPRLVVDPRLTRPPGQHAELISGPLRVEAVGRREGGWRRRWLELEAVGRAALDGWLDTHPGSEPAIARDVAHAVGDGLLFVASSMPIRDLDLAMAAGPARIVSNRGASGIDGFISTAFGLAAGSGEPVVALGGDLAVLHDSNGFLLEPRTDVVFVVINNDGGGIFSFLPQVRQTDVFERAFGTPHGRSFETLARFHRIGYERLEAPRSQIHRALEQGGTWLLEAVTDRAVNPAEHRELSAVVAAAVRESLEG
ncbi:MAG: 2-succinyl-5-enolpyruvyl-6-hydroxy-3-cyclohexene-1-carboxylic-acid synthase [Acidimicrobiia bacterium]|nr:2-succinyl-5-enolpyruvyl-6-hydroxy-3-cyclohexene-1-carboxylic-acid synthase [Acidimicrobiia bacterium]